MKTSQLLGDFTVRAINNGFIVTYGGDMRTGTIPREHFSPSVSGVGEYISNRIRIVQDAAIRREAQDAA